MATPDIAKLDLSDSEDSVLSASPSKAQKYKPRAQDPPPRNGESKYDAEQTREENLQRELEGVRSINEVIEGVISSLECAKGNMDVCFPMAPM